jgi:hypothetical protein
MSAFFKLSITVDCIAGVLSGGKMQTKQTLPGSDVPDLTYASRLGIGYQRPVCLPAKIRPRLRRRKKLLHLRQRNVIVKPLVIHVDGPVLQVHRSINLFDDVCGRVHSATAVHIHSCLHNIRRPLRVLFGPRRDPGGHHRWQGP